MTEATLSAGLVQVLRAGLPSSVVFKHADRATSGIPDISVTWNGGTLWLEVKLVAGGGLIQQGLQRLTLQRMAQAGRCFYVIYDTRDSKIYIRHAAFDVATWRDGGSFDMPWSGHQAVLGWVKVMMSAHERATPRAGGPLNDHEHS